MQAGVDLLVADVMPIYMILPRYSHNYALFYQLLDSNLFTPQCYLPSREKTLVKPMAPSLFSIYHFQIYKPKNPKISRNNLFTFLLFYVLVIFYIYRCQTSSLQVTMKGLTTPLSRWLRGSYLFVQVRGTCVWPPTGLIPCFSKTEGNTYATLLHHPLLFGEIQRSAQEVAYILHMITRIDH